jgi:hypothetical protein
VAPIRQLRPQPSRAAERTVAATAFDPGPPVNTAIEPLTRIEPIEIAPLTQDPIAVAAVTLHPLTTITEMQIAPLNPPDGRN